MSDNLPAIYELIMDQFKNKPLLENQILKKDQFVPHIMPTPEEKNISYVDLRDFGVSEEDIRYIDDMASMEREIPLIKQSEMLGFDTEFRCNDSNENAGGVSIL